MTACCNIAHNSEKTSSAQLRQSSVKIDLSSDWPVQLRKAQINRDYTELYGPKIGTKIGTYFCLDIWSKMLSKILC